MLIGNGFEDPNYNSLEQVNAHLAQEFAHFIDNPLGFVYFAFRWNVGDLRGFHGPDVWQIDFLKEIGRQVKERGFNGVDPVKAIQMATASGHGIGKSALTAWLILWIMCTRPFAKGVVTANTAAQLETKTWAELAKWKKRCIAGHWFNISTGRGNMKLTHKEWPESWRCDAQTCREENSEAFAGLHAANSTPFYIFDEGSAVPDKIYEVAEGGLTDGEPMFFVFGNPTRNNGRFFEMFHRLRHRWTTFQIDSRQAALTNKEKIQEWLEDWGEDSDFFRVRVRGVFPRAGDLQFISGELALAAQTRQVTTFPHNPLIMGVDIARGGADMTVFYFRRGFDGRSIPMVKLRLDNTVQIARMIVAHATGHEHTNGLKCDAVNVDGGGPGAGVVDTLREMQFPFVEVNFGDPSPDPRFFNMAAFMANKKKNWLRYGAISDDPQLYADLTGRYYAYNDKEQLRLERKRDMKARGLPSPDTSDALDLTFAYPVVKQGPDGHNGGGGGHQAEYEVI